MSKCDICGKERVEGETQLTIVVSLIHRLNVCKDCMNDYAQHDYDKLIKKLKEGGN